MYQNMRRSPRMIFAASVVLAGLGIASCGSAPKQEQSAAVPATAADVTNTNPVILSATDGLAARNSAPVRSGAPDAKIASTSSLAADSRMVDPSWGCGVYEPSAAEIVESNAISEAFAAGLDRYGVAYERVTDDFGFVQISLDPFDVVAQSVSQSFWIARYPLEVISQEDLAAQVAQNDVVAEQLDKAQVAYTRTTDEQDYESIDYDYDDPAAQAAVDAAWLIISPPQPPDAETLAVIVKENEAVATAFDAAGVVYERFADELGWQWLEWDYEDQSINDIAAAAYEQLYPPVAIDPIEQCVAVDVLPDDSEAIDPATSGVVDDVADDLTTDVVPMEADSEPSADDIARGDAEIAAMTEGFTTAGVTFEVQGESPWQSVTFDLTNDAGVPVVQAIIATRG